MAGLSIALSRRFSTLKKVPDMPVEEWEDYSDNEDDDTTDMVDDGEDE